MCETLHEAVVSSLYSVNKNILQGRNGVIQCPYLLINYFWEVFDRRRPVVVVLCVCFWVVNIQNAQCVHKGWISSKHVDLNRHLAVLVTCRQKTCLESWTSQRTRCRNKPRSLNSPLRVDKDFVRLSQTVLVFLQNRRRFTFVQHFFQSISFKPSNGHMT